MYNPEINKTQRDRCYTCKGTGTHENDPVFVLELTFSPGWYLEWWGDECGGPYWTDNLNKAEKLTLRRANYEQGMIREVTQICKPNDKDLARRALDSE
jgi:hypothetical protein